MKENRQGFPSRSNLAAATALPPQSATKKKRHANACLFFLVGEAGLEPVYVIAKVVVLQLVF